MNCGVEQGPAVVAFTPSFAPRSDAESLVNTRLVTGLKKAGMRIEVISRRNGAIPKAWSAPGDNMPAPRYHTPWPRLRAVLRNVMGSENAQAARYMVEHAWGVRMAAEAAGRLPPEKCDAVLSFGGYCHMAALEYARASDIPIVANWNDPFPALIAPPPYGEGPDGPVPRCYKRLLARIGQAAGWHVFPSERLRGYMLQFLPQGAAARASVIPHIGGEMPAARSGADGAAFRLTHAGALLPYRRVEVFFEGLAVFLAGPSFGRELQVVLIGPQGDELRAVARRYGADKACQFLPEMEHARCAQYLSDSDALLVIEAQMSESIFLPSKFADYARTRKPILAVAPRRGTIADLIGTYGGGVLADCRSPVEVAAGLESLCFLGRSAARAGGGRLDALFTEEAVAGQYSAVFGRLWRGGPGIHRAVSLAV